VRPSSYAFLFC